MSSYACLGVELPPLPVSEEQVLADVALQYSNGQPAKSVSIDHVLFIFSVFLPLVYQFSVKLPHEVASTAGLVRGEHNAHLHISLVLEPTQHPSSEEHLQTQNLMSTKCCVMLSLTLLFPRRNSLFSS